jgi:UPF0755 protein
LTNSLNFAPQNLKKHMLRKSLIGLLVLTLVGIVLAWKPIKAIFLDGVPTTLQNKMVLIPTGSNFEQVVTSLEQGGFISNAESFTWLAEKMNYKKPEMRPGRFEVQPGWSNRDLIKHLRAGKQTPVELVLTTNERLLEDIAGKAAQFIESDSVTILRTLTDAAYVQSLGFTPETFISTFIPNTYELFWTTTPKQLVERMVKEQKAFWTKNDRAAKAKALNLNPEEVYTVASIVERESNNNAERPTIAGVYLNRLKIGMKLQADPTCVFATRDFATRRVTEYHLLFPSPYNTYLNTGLPPGPISMASISAIDAVLNRAEHGYLYFCAKPDNSGTHAFAETYAGHNVNVAKFRVWQAQNK